MSFTGPHGTPTGLSRRTNSSTVKRAITVCTATSSARRLRLRDAESMKSGWVVSSRASSAPHRPSHIFCVLAARFTRPSLAR